MEGSRLSKSRFVVGLILVITAALMFLFGKGDYATSGVVAIGLIGLASIASSRRK